MRSEDHLQENPETDRTASPSKHQGAESDSPMPPTSAGFQPPPPPPSRDATEQEHGEPNWRNNLTLGVEIVGLVALIVYTCFAGCQWKVANDTLTEIQNSKIDTNRVITASEAQAHAASKIAEAAASFSASAERISQETAHAADQLRRAAADSEVAMRENARDARGALNASIEASKLDERAWLGISETEVLRYDPSDPAKPFRFQILFHNTGKTPARQVHIFLNDSVHDSRIAGPTDSEWKTFLESFDKSTDRWVIGPNETRRYMFADFYTAGRDSFLDLITRNYLLFKERSKYLLIFGQATYLDIDNRQHATKFCLYFVPEVTRFGNCARGNDMD
jgi:hypothetical protein